MNLALIEFLLNLGVTYILVSYISFKTSGMNLFFRNDVLSDKILSTGLVAV